MSEKFAKWIIKSEHSVFNILEGGVRSGKTTTMILAFCRALERLNFNSLNVAFGASSSVARVILLEGGNELGIKNYFGERATVGRYKDKDALFVKVRNYTHIIVFLGSSKSNSIESVRGFTLTCVIGTELCFAHRDFIREIVARTLDASSKDRRIFFDTNPVGANHYIYTEFIDPWVEGDRLGTLLGGVNFDVCSIYENPSMTKTKAAQIVSQYDPNSNTYKALILGERINSADTIYTLYDYNLQQILPLPTKYVVAVDPGVSLSSTVFICLGIGPDNKFYIYDSYEHKNGRANEGKHIKAYPDYVNDLIDFINTQTARFGMTPRHVFIDTDRTFLRLSYEMFPKAGLNKNMLATAIKDKLDDRIQMMGSLLYQELLIIDSSQTGVISAIQNAVYDSSRLEKDGVLVREDKPSPNIDQKNPCDYLDPIDYALSWATKVNRNITVGQSDGPN